MGGKDHRVYIGTDMGGVTLDYAASKGGVISMTREMACYLAQYNIRANCLVLGGLEEPSHDAYFLERYNKRTPLGRMATGEDVKGPIVFLASEASAYMTGANLVIDGGWAAW